MKNSLLVPVVAVVTTLAVSSASSSAALSAGVVSHLQFENNLNAGLAGGSATSTGTINYGTGKFGQGATFTANGANQITLADNLDFGTSDFTISMWVNVSGTVSGDPAFFGNKSWASGSNVGINYAMNSSTRVDVNTFGTARVDWDNGSGPEPTLTVGAWSNLVLARTGTTLHFYLNGTELGTGKTIAAGANFDTAFNYVLGDDGSTVIYNNGTSLGIGTFQVDEFVAWNRGLSGAEVTELQTTAVPEPLAGLIGCFGVVTLLRRRRSN